MPKYTTGGSRISYKKTAVNDPSDRWPAGTQTAVPGSPLGQGVTEAAAEQLGLPAGTPVAAALIDAHAGGLGLMAVRDQTTDPCSRLGGLQLCPFPWQRSSITQMYIPNSGEHANLALLFDIDLASCIKRRRYFVRNKSDTQITI